MFKFFKTQRIIVFTVFLFSFLLVAIPHVYSQTALQFDGVNDYVTFGQSTSTLGVTNFTVEAWIKRSSGGSAISTGTLGLGTGSYPSAYPVVTKGRGEAESPANINTNYFIGIATTGVIAADFEDTINEDIQRFITIKDVKIE